jgi:glutathione S-transferase
MGDPIVYGFPRSTYVNIVRLILTHKDVAYSFHDLEPVMGQREHLALHPFNRVPIVKHDDLIVYETSAIASYVDEAFGGPRLTPQDVRKRARMNQWISAVNSYYYPYMIYHVTHERLVFPELGIASDEKVVAHALPKVETALAVVERELAHGHDYLLGSELTIADFFLLPSTFAFSLTEEGKALYPSYPAFLAGTHGKSAGNAKTARNTAAARTHSARARVGEFAPPEILTPQIQTCRKPRQGLT